MPWWALGPAALHAQANTQAQAYWKPVLDEYHAQQRDAQRQAAANLAGVQKLIEIVKAKAQSLGQPISAAFQHGANADYGSSDLAGQARDMYSQEGAAYSHIGDAYSQEAGNSGEAQYLNVVQDSNKIARDLLNEIMQVTQKIPGTAEDIYGQMSTAQSKYRTGQQSDYNTAYNRALQTAKYYTDKTGVLYIVADTPSGPQLVEAKDKKGKPISTDGLTPYQKASLTARATVSKAAAARDAKKPGATKMVNGVLVQYDPITKTWNPAPGNLPVKPAKAKKPPTAAVIKAGWKTIGDSYYHPIGSTRKLSVAELDKKIAQTNAARQDAWEKADPAKRPPNPPGPIARADIARMTPAQKRILGIAGVETPAQEVYLALVHSGIPARKAWTMVRKTYPGFGPDYFKSGGVSSVPAIPSGRATSDAAVAAGPPGNLPPSPPGLHWVKVGPNKYQLQND